MPIFLLYIIIIFIIIYLINIIRFIIGINKSYSINLNKDLIPISIIVAIKNGEKNIILSNIFIIAMINLEKTTMILLERCLKLFKLHRQVI